MDGYVIGDSTRRRRFAMGLFVATTLVLLTSTALIVDTVAWANGELREALRNMTFPSEWTRSGQAPLVGGIYEEPAAQDSASKIVIRLTDSVAVGAIGGQTAAALVIVTDPGGSGVFFDLYLVQKRENRWRVMDRAHLGDRIRVNTIEVERGLIGLDLTVHGLRDGTCCPTERRRVYYALHGERLVKVNVLHNTSRTLLKGLSGDGSMPFASTGPGRRRQSQGTTPCISGLTGNSTSGPTVTRPEGAIDWRGRI